MVEDVIRLDAGVAGHSVSVKLICCQSAWCLTDTFLSCCTDHCPCHGHSKYLSTPGALEYLSALAVVERSSFVGSVGQVKGT